MTKPDHGHERSRISWVLVAVLVMVLWLLTGCASVGDQHDWKHTRPASAKPWFYVTVDDPDSVCRLLGSQASHSVRVDGCAVWKPAGCEIYVPAGAPDWLVAHEEKHCNGYTH